MTGGSGAGAFGVSHGPPPLAGAGTWLILFVLGLLPLVPYRLDPFSGLVYLVINNVKDRNRILITRIFECESFYLQEGRDKNTSDLFIEDMVHTLQRQKANLTGPMHFWTRRD